MTAPTFMTQHPTDEILAEYVDNLLQPASRQEVTRHLTGCAGCREIVMTTSDIQADEQSNVRQFGAKQWLATVAALAAAAAIAIVLLRPEWVFPPKMDDLIAATSGAKERPSPGRLVNFDFAEEPTKLRGKGQPTKTASEITLAAITIAGRARDLHVEGVALFIAAEGDPEYLNAAIAKLAEARQEAGSETRDAVAIDYTTALLARETDRDLQEALQISEDVAKRTGMPEALWNRAYALEYSRRYKDALAAWDEYLKVDPSSRWSAEAKERREELVELLSDMQ